MRDVNKQQALEAHFIYQEGTECILWSIRIACLSLPQQKCEEETILCETVKEN
jgi:hypothetical protein